MSSASCWGKHYDSTNGGCYMCHYSTTCEEECNRKAIKEGKAEVKEVASDKMREETAKLMLGADMPEIFASLAMMAQMNWKYFQELVAQGFTEQQAIQLIGQQIKIIDISPK